MNQNDRTGFEVLLFGGAAEMAGADRVTVALTSPETAPVTAGTLMQALADQFPPLADAVRVGQLAVNHVLADASMPVRGDEELALIAMVSGG